MPKIEGMTGGLYLEYQHVYIMSMYNKLEGCCIVLKNVTSSYIHNEGIQQTKHDETQGEVTSD